MRYKYKSLGTEYDPPKYLALSIEETEKITQHLIDKFQTALPPHKEIEDFIDSLYCCYCHKYCAYDDLCDVLGEDFEGWLAEI